MRFTAAALAIFLAAPSAFSFTVPPQTTFVPRTVTTQSISRRHGTIAQLVETSGGMIELQEIAEPENQSSVDKIIQKSPSFWKLAGYASIPISAALGFGLVPSRRIAAHAAGAVVTGIAGAVGKSRLDAALTDNFARPSIAQALVDENSGGFLEDATGAAQRVNQVQTEYGILDEDFEEMCTEMYTKYLTGMVKLQVQPKTSELKELEAIKTALSLDNLQVGEAHAAAAAEWYRSTCLFTPEEDLDDPDHPDRKAMDKLLFLTERALRQGGETEEAFVFEMTRTAKALNLDYQTALDRVAEVVEPFYQRALKSTRSKLGTSQVSSGMLERARRTLGVSDETAFDMHVSCFNEEVKSLLGKTADSEDGDDDEDASELSEESMKFPEGAMERLNQLKDILALSDRDIQYELSVEATPLYQATALASMKDVLAGSKTPDDAWEIMDARREELLLAEDSSKALVSSMVMQALGVPLEEANKFAKVNNEAATYDHLLEALEAKEALISILTKSGWEEFDKFDEIFCDPWDKQSANGFLFSEDRIKMYRIFLTRSIRKSESGKMSDGMYADVMEVKGLLGISDEQAEIESRGAFGPELKKVMQRAMEEIVEDYTPELAVNMQKQIDDVMESYHLKQDFLRELGATFYAKAVAIVSSKAPAGIPSEDLSQSLVALRDMYQIEIEDTYEPHVEYFGSVYRKSVLEAMGTTGVIRPEFRGPLEDLRDRLGVSDDACKKIFLEAVEEKMVPMVEWIGSEMERTMLTQQQISKRRGKDMGEDVFQSGKGADGVLGLGAEVNIMSDIMNLVDFYTENDIAEEKQVGTKSVEKPPADGEEEGTVEEVPVYETAFPVTALGADAIDQEMAELLYRQFVVGAFQTQGPQAARYEGSRATFGGILGLTSEKMEEINDNIGNTVYDNFVTHSMKTKGALDQQDMMFLANIQGKLGLSSDQGEKMLLQSQKKVLSEEIEVLMDEPTPDGAKAFREKCNVMGMDLTEDVGVSIPRLTRMFESEIIPGLKSGEISPENAEILTEIQESLGLEPEDCESMFENTLMRLATNAMNLVKGEILRGREENTVELIAEIVRYAGFVDGDLGLEVEEATANKVISMYEAFDFEGVDEETIEDNKELLKLAVGLS